MKVFTLCVALIVAGLYSAGSGTAAAGCSSRHPSDPAFFGGSLTWR